MAVPLLGRPWHPRVQGMEGASCTVARSLCSFIVVQSLGSWTLVLDSLGTDCVMSCVATGRGFKTYEPSKLIFFFRSVIVRGVGPVCFMLGALAAILCLFGGKWPLFAAPPFF
jgi:hypothetical protein